MPRGEGKTRSSLIRKTPFWLMLPTPVTKGTLAKASDPLGEEPVMLWTLRRFGPLNTISSFLCETIAVIRSPSSGSISMLPDAPPVQVVGSRVSQKYSRLGLLATPAANSRFLCLAMKAKFGALAPRLLVLPAEPSHRCWTSVLLVLAQIIRAVNVSKQGSLSASRPVVIAVHAPLSEVERRIS